jgi:hypothetical protein
LRANAYRRTKPETRARRMHVTEMTKRMTPLRFI